MSSLYGSLTIDQLKMELRKRNARVSGRKAELIERLEAYDRNSNFGKTEGTHAEYKMQLPGPVAAHYKDLHADEQLPPLEPQNYFSLQLLLSCYIFQPWRM